MLLIFKSIKIKK